MTILGIKSGVFLLKVARNATGDLWRYGIYANRGTRHDVLHTNTTALRYINYGVLLRAGSGHDALREVPETYCSIRCWYEVWPQMPRQDTTTGHGVCYRPESRQAHQPIVLLTWGPTLCNACPLSEVPNLGDHQSSSRMSSVRLPRRRFKRQQLLHVEG